MPALEKAVLLCGGTDISEELMQDFQEYLLMKNMSSNTLRSYLYAVEQFYRLYHQLTAENLQFYKLFLLERYKPQTVNLRIRALNCFLEFQKAGDDKIVMVKVQQKTFLERIISEGDYEYFKSCLIRDGEHLYYFIVRFIAATGVRVSELVQISAEDVWRGYKDIYSKDNKTRRIYIPCCLQKDAKAWLSRENRLSGPIFLNRFGNPISPAGIRNQLKKMACRYGIDPNVVYPHSFRHRFAKNFIERCGDIALLSDLLGHESIETTRIYLRRSSSEQYQIVNRIVDW